MPPRAVTFDVNYTLLVDPDRHGGTRARLRRVHAWLHELGHEVGADRLQEAYDAAERARMDAWRDRRHLATERAVESMLAFLGVDGGPHERAALALDLERPEPGWRLDAVPGTRPALERLRAAGCRLGVVSNLGYVPGRLIREQLARTGLAELFEPPAMIFSDEDGRCKPHPEVFLLALRRLGADPGDAVHVGDSRLADVAGARAAGMRTVRYAGCRDDGDGPEADRVVHRYRDLGAALGLDG